MEKKNNSLLKFLKTKEIAIIGYGSQGRAQALNLRDSGIKPIIGLESKSKSRKIAKADGFNIVVPVIAIERSDIIAILIPDHKHQEFFQNLPSKNILNGKSLIFAHGMSVAFGLADLPKKCDVILVAPHGPGIRLRELYQKSGSFTSFWGVEQNYSGNASKTAKAYAMAIGSPPQNLFKSSFKTEAIGDIFGEQAVLCGGLFGLMETGFDSLVKKGFSAETGYLECIYQLDLIIDLVKKFGPAGMLERISKTAAFGSIQSRSKLFDRQMKQRMEKLFCEIENGDFARSLMKANENHFSNFDKQLKNLKRSHIQKAHRSLSKRLSRP